MKTISGNAVYMSLRFVVSSVQEVNEPVMRRLHNDKTAKKVRRILGDIAWVCHCSVAQVDCGEQLCCVVARMRHCASGYMEHCLII